MHKIDVTDGQAEAFLSALAEHLPPGAQMGRPLMMTPGGLVTADGATTALLALDEDRCGAWRLATLPGGLGEVTEWANGVETARRIVRDGSPGDGPGPADVLQPVPDPDPVTADA